MCKYCCMKRIIPGAFFVTSILMSFVVGDLGWSMESKSESRSDDAASPVAAAHAAAAQQGAAAEPKSDAELEKMLKAAEASLRANLDAKAAQEFDDYLEHLKKRAPTVQELAGAIGAHVNA